MTGFGNYNAKYTVAMPSKDKGNPSPMPQKAPVDKRNPNITPLYSYRDGSTPSPMPPKAPIDYKNPIILEANPIGEPVAVDYQAPIITRQNPIGEPPEGTFVFFDALGKTVDKLLYKQGGDKTVVNISMDGVTAFGGTQEAPQSLFIEDKSTGKINTYIYRKVSPSEIANGCLDTGEKISKGQFEKGKTYYVLVSAGNNNDSIKNEHVEIYSLNYSEKDGVPSYTLEQDAGMDGAGKSSVKIQA